MVSEKILTSPDVPKAPAHVTYSIRKGSIYYIVETNVGINILWNAENAVKVQLYPSYKRNVSLEQWTFIAVILTGLALIPRLIDLSKR